MRRSDRELTDRQEILHILARVRTVRVAVCDGTRPYLIPLTFGMAEENGVLTLYFHGAAEGRKATLFAARPEAAFEADIEGPLTHSQADMGCTYSTLYESVCGTGRIAPLTARNEKRAALAAVMRQLAPERTFTFPDAAVDAVCCWALTVTELVGKCKR